MYCSSCGSAVPPNLTYCNRCGAKVSGSRSDSLPPSGIFPESLVWAIVSLFIGGIGVIIGLMAVMRNIAGFEPALILGIVMMCFALMVALQGVLIWFLLSARRDARRSSIEQLKEHTTSELSGGRPQALQEPLTSVADQTTRAFDPVLIERNSK